MNLWRNTWRNPEKISQQEYRNLQEECLDKSQIESLEVLRKELLQEFQIIVVAIFGGTQENFWKISHKEIPNLIAWEIPEWISKVVSGEIPGEIRKWIRGKKIGVLVAIFEGVL